MEPSSPNSSKSNTQSATLIERVVKILVILGVCFMACVAFFFHREHREAELDKLSGHVLGGELTYAYPQGEKSPVTAIKLKPYSLNGRGWELGGELILCGDVRNQFRGHHWVNVKYERSDYCAKLDLVEDDPRTARSPKDVEDCVKASSEFPNQHLEACDDQAAAASYMAAGQRYLGSVGMDFTHDMFASGWVLTQVPDTPGCYVARSVKYRYLHDQDTVEVALYLLPPWLHFENFIGPPERGIEIPIAELRAYQRRLIVVPTRERDTPQGAEELTVVELLKHYGAAVDLPEGQQQFGAIVRSSGGGVTAVTGSDVLLVSRSDLERCKERVEKEQELHRWQDGHFLEVAVARDESDADRIAGELRIKQYRTWVNKQTGDGTAKVMIGPLETIEEAELQRQKLNAEGLKAVVLH